MGLMVQVKVADPDALVPSFAVTVTLAVCAVVGVPLITPVEELIDSPVGRPVAVYVRVWPEPESVALIARLTELPSVVVWAPGLVTVTVLTLGLVTVQVK